MNTSTAASRILLLCTILLLGLYIPGGASAETESKTFTAFSLNGAKNILEDRGAEQGVVESLGNITKIFGIVVDSETGDCIVVGQRDPSRPEIKLDDLIVALRSVFILGGEEAPGVTIDPRGDMRHARMQDVHYFGGVENTRFGKVCYESDFLMKRIGLGLQPVNISGFNTYFDLSVEEIKQSNGQRIEVGSRFWFYPTVARVISAGDGVFLDRCRIEVLTELLYAEVDGKPVDDLGTFNHRPSDKYAESFSKNLAVLAEKFPVIADLENLTELAAVARGLSKLDNQPSLSYWLTEYSPGIIQTVSEVEVLSNESKTAGFFVQGGVYLESLSVRLKGGDPSAFTELVLAARPDPDSLTWSFILTSEWDVMLQGLPGEVDASTAVEYYVRGDYFFQSQKYDLAIACWKQVLYIYPDMGDIYYKIGAAFERKGMDAAAASNYTKGLELDPWARNPRI